MRIIRNALWLAAGTASSVLVSIIAIPAVGSIASSDPSGTATLTESEVISEYDESLKTFDGEFPPGDVPASPARYARAFGSADDEVRYEVGYSESLVIARWRCAWQREWLSAAGAEDVDRMSTAKLNLDNYANLEFTRKWVVDPENLWFRTVVEPAYDGDPSAMESDVANNC